MNTKEDLLTPEEVMDDVFEAAEASWLELGEKVKSGDILFKEFNRHFKRMDRNVVERELSMLSPTQDTTWIPERLEQFEQFQILEQCVTGAKIIMEVVEGYQLKGDFGRIAMIENLVC